MNNSIYPDDPVSSKSVGEMRKGMIGNWINTNTQNPSTNQDMSKEVTNDPTSSTGFIEVNAILTELRQSAEGYTKMVNELWAQSCKTSKVNWPDPTEDEMWRTEIGKMIEDLTEDLTVDLQVKNEVSGLRARCQTQFDEITQLKKRNSSIEPYRVLLNRANDLTRSTISSYQGILNGTLLAKGGELDSQFREMAKSYSEINQNSSKINQAVRLVAQQGLKERYTDIFGVNDDSDTDTDSEYEYGNRHHYAQGETYEFQPQEHELITEIESWTQSKSNVQTAGFPSELMDLLPKKYKSLLTSGLASSKGDIPVYKVFKA
ncbi:hypothetical protein L486_04598 [Kwoniella mangroviensis CBS 10435]|uniref:Uncharacterized protein n=1 Tax=Kwoniella mangroviensis CBS 10435 TaxID=1331196 RepID=A0A1B9INL4_9TREE|nr:hypothetical protein L486_04598 [Kwoniella mangroviensis CBS 10435]